MLKRIAILLISGLLVGGIVALYQSQIARRSLAPASQHSFSPSQQEKVPSGDDRGKIDTPVKPTVEAAPGDIAVDGPTAIASTMKFKTQFERPLSQADIEAKAIAYAQSTGLQDTPTSIVSKQMTIAEFDARVDPFANDATDVVTQVWLVVMKGDFAVANLPGPNGDTIFTKYDNGWVLLGTDGKIIGQGNQAPGHEVDLSVPPKPIQSWPTPENPNK